MLNQSTECLSPSSRMLQTGHSSLDLQEKSLLICRAGQLKAPSDKDCSTTNDNSESGRHEIENDNIESFSDANMLNRTPGDSLTATKRVGASLNNPDATICNNEATTSNPTTAAGVVSNLGASSCNEDATSCNSDATKYNADATLCNTGKIVPNTEDIKNEDEIIGIQSKDSAENCLRGDASVLVIDTKVESKQQPEDCKYCVETVVTRDGEENMEYLAKSRDKYDAKKREVNIVEDYEAHIEEPFIVAINRCNSKSKSTVRLSLISNSSTEGHCRICHCGGEDETLISPCSCSGSLQYVHESCLVHWMQSKMVDSCELCQRKIEVVRKVKPFCSWKRPTQRPSPLLWLATFFVAFALNVASVVKDASNSCTSTNCVVFYIVGCIGAILTSSFGVYFAIKARDFFKHWKTLNEHWVIIDKNCVRKQQQTGYENRNVSLFCKFFSRQRITTVV